MSVIRVEQFNDLSEINSKDWNDLLARSETKSPFLFHEWISCWWDVFKENRKLFVLVAYESDRIVGFAPLMVRSKRRGLITRKVIEWIGSDDAISLDFIIEPQSKVKVLHAFFEYLDKNKNIRDLIILNNIPEDSSTIQFLSSNIGLFRAQSNKSKAFEFCILSLNDDTIKWLNNIEKSDNASNPSDGNMPDYEYKSACDAREILSELDSFMKIHDDFRLFHNDRTEFMRGKASDFLKCITSKLVQNNTLHLRTLKNNDELVAFHIGFTQNKKLVSYIYTMNLDYYLQNPLRIFIKSLINESINKGINEIEISKEFIEVLADFPFKSRKNYCFEISGSGISNSISEIALSFSGLFSRLSSSITRKIRSKLNHILLKDLFGEAVYLIKKNGIIGLCSMVIQRIIKGGYIYFSPTIVLFKMDLADRNRSRAHEGFVIRDGRLSDWLEMVGQATIYRRRKFMLSALNRFKDGERFFVVEKDGKLIHYSWVSFTDKITLPEARTIVDLPQKAWYMYNSYTAPEARRQGIYTAMLIHVAYELGDTGGEELYGYIMAGNISAKSGIGKTGAWPRQIHKITQVLGFIVRRKCETLPKPPLDAINPISKS